MCSMVQPRKLPVSDWDQEVLRVLKPVPTPSKYWMFIPALLLLALVVVLQRGRTARAARKEAVV